MNELIREYGEVMVVIILGISLMATVGFTWEYISAFIVDFYFTLLGGR